MSAIIMGVPNTSTPPAPTAAAVFSWTTTVVASPFMPTSNAMCTFLSFLASLCDDVAMFFIFRLPTPSRQRPERQAIGAQSAGFCIIMHYGRLLSQGLERQVLFCMVAQFQRVAHRGGSLLAPENTLAAFAQALSLSIDAIELDVHMSRDGQVVVLHDQTVDRVTNGTGNVADLNV